MKISEFFKFSLFYTICLKNIQRIDERIECEFFESISKGQKMHLPPGAGTLADLPGCKDELK